jgi:hypothetical protein
MAFFMFLLYKNLGIDPDPDLNIVKNNFIAGIEPEEVSDAWSHREVHHQAERQIPAQQKPVLRRVLQLHEEAHRL